MADRRGLAPVPLAAAAPAAGGLLALGWVAFKVGALSYGGGFVIIPLMQHDAVHTYHWMSDCTVPERRGLGQITPGPVVQTVAVGYAAAGVGGAPAGRGDRLRPPRSCSSSAAPPTSTGSAPTSRVQAFLYRRRSRP